VHTPPRALHPEGIPRGATATRVMPPAALSDDALFGEPEEDTNTTAPERAPLLAEDDGGFEIEHPVRFNEPAEQSDDGSRSYGELGQSFSISRETLTEPAPEEATPPRVRSAPAPAPSLAADDDSDLPWAEPIDLDQESDGDSGDDSIEAAKFAERLPPLPPPARAEPPSRPEPRAEVRFAEESPRRAAPTAPALDPRVVHESLEKVAWEAFGPLSEQIMQEVVKRVEAIAWEVVPQLAERLIREEIAQLKKSE